MQYHVQNLVITRPVLISAIEAVTRPMSQNIASLNMKVEKLTYLVKEAIQDKKMEAFLVDLETVKGKIESQQKVLEDAVLGKKTL